MYVASGALLVLCLVALFFVAVLVAAVVDMRTGRGYGLGIVSFLLLACTVVVFVTVTIVEHQQRQQSLSTHKLGEGVLLVLYFVPATYAMGLVMIGAAIVAGRARQWRWVAGFAIAVVVPVLVVVSTALQLPFWQEPQVAQTVQNIGFIGILFVPEATTLTYSITRLVHPVAPAFAR